MASFGQSVVVGFEFCVSIAWHSIFLFYSGINNNSSSSYYESKDPFGCIILTFPVSGYLCTSSRSPSHGYLQCFRSSPLVGRLLKELILLWFAFSAVALHPVV